MENIINSISSSFNSAAASAKESYDGMSTTQKTGLLVAGVGAIIVAAAGTYAYKSRTPTQGALFDRINAVLVDGKRNLEKAKGDFMLRGDGHAVTKLLYITRLTMAIEVAEKNLERYSGVNADIPVKVVEAIEAEFKDIGDYKPGKPVSK